MPWYAICYHFRHIIDVSYAWKLSGYLGTADKSLHRLRCTLALAVKSYVHAQCQKRCEACQGGTR